MKIKKGDKVIVIAGADKGKVGVVQRAFPKLNRVVVDGVNTVIKHRKPKQNNAEGSRVEMYAPIDVSNVAIYDAKRLEFHINLSMVKKFVLLKRATRN